MLLPIRILPFISPFVFSKCCPVLKERREEMNHLNDLICVRHYASCFLFVISVNTYILITPCEVGGGFILQMKN